MRIEQCDTVKASTSRGQFPLLSDYVVCDEQDLASLKSFACRNFLRLFFLSGIEDADPLTSVTEDRNSLRPFTYA